MEQLQLLWQLQELEQKISRREHELQNLPTVIEYQRRKKEFALFQQELKAKEEELKALQKELRRKELELQTISNSLKEMDKKLYSGEIRNVKELESLEKKVRVGKSKKSELEDEILFLMEKLERETAEVSSVKALEEKKSGELHQLALKARSELH